MRLETIPLDKYNDYKIDAMFDCYKWDPQFLDNNTVSKHVLVLTEREYKALAQLTEKLDLETRASEEFLNKNFKLAKKLKLPRKIYKDLKKMTNYNSCNNVRLMRYDFHPTVDSEWAVSEVNSDVPGGFAEASLLPKLALKVLDNKNYYSIDFGEILANSIKNKTIKNGTIMFVHCTSYSDDRQVMQFIGDKMSNLGFNSIYGGVNHLKFVDKKAISVLDGNKGSVDFIFRFTPIEWLKDIKPKTWHGYFDTITPSCNHPIATFTQTKRFPLIWDCLEKNGINLDTWKKLQPHTCEVDEVKGLDNYIYKPACGRVGERISIKEACEKDEYKQIIKDVKRHPKEYLAQEKFISKPLISPEGDEFHVCLGSYTIDGRHAGFYARISKKLRIDSDAADIPVLIERRNNK